MAPDAAPPSPVPPPQFIIREKPSTFGRFGKWLVAGLVIAVIFAIAQYSRYKEYFSPTNVPQEKYHSLAKLATKKIAIIDVSGPILSGEDGFAMQQIKRVKEDRNVVGVVLRINSPGGTVTASDYIFHHLRQLVEERKLPLVVSMGGVCASGGYYIAMSVGGQADAVYAEPTTWTGSIGVIIPHYDLSGSLSKIGVSDDSIASGPLKQIGSPTRPMNEKEREILQTLVDDSFKSFKEIVTSGRPKYKDDPAALDAVATGQIFTAQQALDKGLVDKIGFVEEAIARATSLAGETAESVRCVKYERRPTLVSALVGAEAQASPSYGGLDLSAIIDATTPRAYYLWSWLPAALSNAK